jgi:hypothetical protein
MPMYRCWHWKLIDEFRMKAFRLDGAVTLFPVRSRNCRHLYRPAEYRDWRLARKKLNGFWPGFLSPQEQRTPGLSQSV